MQSRPQNPLKIASKYFVRDCLLVIYNIHVMKVRETFFILPIFGNNHKDKYNATFIF